MTPLYLVALYSVSIASLVAWTLGHAQEPNKPPPAAPNRVRIFAQTLIAAFFVLYLGLMVFNSVPTTGGQPPATIAAPAYDMQLGEPPF